VTIASVEIIGAGVAGLCCALLFAERGCDVSVRSASDGIDDSCCSWWAGGMLAPWCELESAEPLIATLGVESMSFWSQQSTDTVLAKGSLVVANARDIPDLVQFSKRTSQFRKVDAQEIATLEPDLAGRFDSGLFFTDECHLDPRAALIGLKTKLEEHLNVRFETGNVLDETERAKPTNCDWRIDCRGLAARDVLKDLRGVRGEMLLLHAPDVTLNRPVRLLHPRIPLYIVPRADGVFMVGATMIESDHRGQPTARSIMELLSAAYSLQPAFAEATVLEMGADARPAFSDNLPRLRRRGTTLYVNGLFRHGFLCAPAMARRAVELALDNKVDSEVVDENYS
jgi:glycine oxidase